jgi:hypothetical protein
VAAVGRVEQFGQAVGAGGGVGRARRWSRRRHGWPGWKAGRRPPGGCAVDLDAPGRRAPAAVRRCAGGAEPRHASGAPCTSISTPSASLSTQPARPSSWPAGRRRAGSPRPAPSRARASRGAPPRASTGHGGPQVRRSWRSALRARPRAAAGGLVQARARAAAPFFDPGQPLVHALAAGGRHLHDADRGLTRRALAMQAATSNAGRAAGRPCSAASATRRGTCPGTSAACPRLRSPTAPRPCAPRPGRRPAGQTRLPTFSIISTESGGCQALERVSTIAASRWQPLPVLICSAGAPVARMRSASLLVCWSPSITATGSRPASSSMVRTSRRGLARAGAGDEVQRQHAAPRQQRRGCAAAWPSFLARMSRSICTMRAWLMPGTEPPAAPVP